MTPKPLQDSKQPTDAHPNAHGHGDNHRHDDADHSHSHSHTDNQRIITIAFAIIASYMIVEVIGGYITGSLALLSDAGHMFSDAVSLAMTLFAFIIGKKSATSNKTFGYRRFEILIALINGLTLLIISAGIVYEAVLRFQQPPQIATTGMLVISTIGLIVNLVVAKLMHGGDTDNLNMKSAYLHVLSDLLGSVAAIIAAIVIMLFGWVWADAAVSILVALLIVRSGYAVVKNAAHPNATLGVTSQGRTGSQTTNPSGSTLKTDMPEGIGQIARLGSGAAVCFNNKVIRQFAIQHLVANMRS